MRELILAYEAFDLTDDDNPKFHHIEVVWKEDGDFFHVQHPDQTFDLNELSAEAIPKNHYRCLWYDGLTVAPDSSSPGCYIKVPSLCNYDGTPIVSELLLAEAQVMERLKTTPHKNVCTYYGCVREGASVVGLCLKRYRTTLDEAVEDENSQFDHESVIDGIRSGLDFLHSLGLAHNDLNPTNIMFDDDGIPVIIDFDTCAREGARLEKSGTFGWSKQTSLSAKSNDDDAFKLIERFIKGKYLPGDASRM